MFENAKYLWKLNQLIRRKHKTTSSYQESFKKAVREKWAQNDKRALEGAANYETQLVEEEIAALMSSNLIEQAQRYRLPTPDYGEEEKWVEASLVGGMYLSDAAMADLRSAIRKERNEIWQFWELRLKVIGAVAAGLTGAFGALIGLISIWGK